MKKIIISLLTGIGLLGFGVNVIMADAPASDNTRAIDAAVPEITNVNCNHIDNDGNGICDNCNINRDDNQKCRNCQWNYYDENGDGICDNCNVNCPSYSANGYSNNCGHHNDGNSHHARNHGHH